MLKNSKSPNNAKLSETITINNIVKHFQETCSNRGVSVKGNMYAFKNYLKKQIKYYGIETVTKKIEEGWSSGKIKGNYIDVTKLF